jgi:hypothetical protein
MTICAKCKHCRPDGWYKNATRRLENGRCGAVKIVDAYEKVHPVTGEVTSYEAAYKLCADVNLDGNCPHFQQAEPKPKQGLWARFLAYANSPASNTGPK